MDVPGAGHARKRLPVVALLLAVCGSHAGTARAADPTGLEAWRQLVGVVLKVQVQRSQGGSALGSGVVVAPDRVATNCHVTQDGVRIEVGHLGQRHAVTAQVADPLHDLCLLQVPGLQAQPASLGRANRLRAGQVVMAVGYTGGVRPQASRGDVVGLHRLDGSPVIQSSNRFSSGASGGGLFDDQGRLVGLLTFRMRGADSGYFAAPVEWLLPMLEPGAAWRPVAPLDAGAVAYWQLPDPQQPEFLRAATLAQSGRWQELMELASRWSQVSVRNPQPWLAIGQAAEALDHRSEAVVAFQRAVSIDPSFATGWLHLGLLYARLGLFERARQAQQALVSLNPGFAAQIGERL